MSSIGHNDRKKSCAPEHWMSQPERNWGFSEGLCGDRASLGLLGGAGGLKP